MKIIKKKKGKKHSNYQIVVNNNLIATEENLLNINIKTVE